MWWLCGGDNGITCASCFGLDWFGFGQDARGASSCKKCGWGYYQKATGQTTCDEMQMEVGCKDPYGLEGESKLKRGYCAIQIGDGELSCIRDYELQPASLGIHAQCSMCNSAVNHDTHTFRSVPVRARREIAVGKPTKAYPGRQYGHEDNVVDGNDKLLWTVTAQQATGSMPEQFTEFPSTCFASAGPASSSYPISWWRVDLEGEYEIDTIAVYAPEASPVSSNSVGGYFFVQVGKTNPGDTSHAGLTACTAPTVNGARLPRSYPDGYIVDFDCKGAVARYVWVRRVYAHVSLCEVKVYTREPEPEAVREGVVLQYPRYAILNQPWRVWPATVSAWVMIAVETTEAPFILLGTETGKRAERGYNIVVLSNGRVQISWDGGSVVRTTPAPSTVRDGSMHHLAVVHQTSPSSQAGFHVYIDGKDWFLPVTARAVYVMGGMFACRLVACAVGVVSPVFSLIHLRLWCRFVFCQPCRYPVKAAVFGRDYVTRSASAAAHVEHIEVHSRPFSQDEVLQMMARTAGTCPTGRNVLGCYTLRNTVASESRYSHEDGGPVGNDMRMWGVYVCRRGCGWGQEGAASCTSLHGLNTWVHCVGVPPCLCPPAPRWLSRTATTPNYAP